MKPLTHWVIYKGYRVRFRERTPEKVTGVLTTATGEVAFSYDPMNQVVTLPDAHITINEYGWELNQVQRDE